ncbi:hypothetical protein TREMEDRAFT_29362 [Tremella mesenterica DSM 1558]|uniref:uncharacterized protein n=1 Tax=Tremella mesenterica (strain ATCC 24925 / CBS 8224 / DSM 1558 / NBRC 9311 / NRRL Y-6157 / RJB 2259-6 / UBC 559-6) TaxID=578456 RepID=UPI0003F49188|nr:uncharacterized protein TREMEDRAFT_29362 [Tremella mesenterica DSM 1558]EIW70025.1 hypothetical protein TREMEDRAFT_29362 [Tremella mesenterica DSM 1558]
MADPRPSTDEESAPLLNHDNHVSFLDSIYRPSRPISKLEKLLGLISIILLILTSTFIGLFAGSQSALNRSKGVTTITVPQGTITTTKNPITTTVSTNPTSSVPIPTGKPDRNVCITPQCVLLSAGILQSMNTTQDPCEDFYEYATGGWSSSHSIPPDRASYGSFNAVADDSKVVLLKVINAIPDELPKDAGPEERNLHKVKAAFSSCMDTDTLNDIGIKPLSNLLEELLDIFGPLDVNVSVDTDALTSSSDWSEDWNENYTLPPDLLVAAEKMNFYRDARKTGPITWSKRPMPLAVSLNDEDNFSFDPERRDRITSALAFLHSHGVEALLNFNIEGDVGGADPQVQSLWLYQAFGGLPAKEYYEEKPIFDLYVDVLSKLLIHVTATSTIENSDFEQRDLLDDILTEVDEFVGLADEEESQWPWPWPDKDGETSPPRKPTPPKHGDSREERFRRLAFKVAQFERELVRAGADLEYLFNPHFAYNPYETRKVEKALPFFDLPTYLASMSPRTFPENITVTHPPYLQAVTKLVHETPDYVLGGYFAMKLGMTYAGALGPNVEVRKEKTRLNEVLRGIKKGTPENREDVCLASVDDIVGFIVGREFVKETFSPEAKADAEDIINSIIHAFHDKLPDVKWMDAESAKAAQLKAEAIIPKVGYPSFPNTTDPASLERWYGRTIVEKGDFFGAVISSTLVEGSRTWLTLGRQRDRGGWDMYPQTVNAYFSPSDNEIVFPAAILNPPFYSHAWPDHLKYGAFGSVAAHELTHAFDNSGSQYDEHGRLREWWSNATVEAFEERAQCVSKQYSHYWVLDQSGNKVYVNGNLTNGEDIADSGLAQAYTAWQNKIKESGESIALPGLEQFSDEQLFFIAFARIWAQLIRPQAAVQRIRTDPHSPNQWRTIGTLRNNGEFAKAWNCKVGSGMRPKKEDRCELW